MLKRIFLLISLLWLTACNRVPVPEVPRYQAGDTATVVRMHTLYTVDMGVLPLVQVVLGEEAGWWLIDTGSSHNLIATALAQRLELAVVGGSEIATIGGRKSSTHHKLPVLKVGHLKLDGQSASALDLSGLSAPDSYRISGVLGMPALQHLVLALDYRNRTVRLSNTRLSAVVPNQTMIPFRFNSGVPVVNLRVDKHRWGNFILDTGNATALVMLPSMRRLPSDKALHFIEVADPSGTIPTQLAVLRQLQLGQRRFQNIPVSLPLNGHHVNGIDGSLGNGILSRQEVVFDFPQRQLILNRYRQPTDTLPGGFGFLLAQDNIVSVVNVHSPAAQAGLQRGDTILAVGKVDTRQAGAHTIWQQLHKRQTAELLVLRGEQQLSVRLQRGHYLPELE